MTSGTWATTAVFLAGHHVGNYGLMLWTQAVAALLANPGVAPWNWMPDLDYVEREAGRRLQRALGQVALRKVHGG